MARKNKKRKSFPQSTTAVPTIETTKKKPAKKKDGGQPIRETVESLVVAFVLAFLFRTFQAEAFVIPTGSMAPTLMGRHKDVFCDECGQRFKVNASTEAGAYSDLRRQFGNGSALELRHMATCVGGVCSSCRFPMAFTNNLVNRVERAEGFVDEQRSYSGDRILVNKYVYEFSDPERWDVVVFKFPGDANTNYIKRLVGLPEEDLRIYQGDIFVKPAGSTEPREIARKSPSKVLAMRQLVHDTDRESATLQKAGWPSRWSSADDAAVAWQAEDNVDGRQLRQSFRVAAPAGQTAWLRYHHRPPNVEAWADVWDGRPTTADQARPQLITDYNAYNSEVVRALAYRDGQLGLGLKDQGLHWVGDLIVEADVEVESDSGELLLELVEAGQHFLCTFDLTTGKASLSARAFETGEAITGVAATAQTNVRGAGSYRLRLANVDDQLTLWVNGSVVEFDGETTYNADVVFASNEILPRTSAADAGDLAPAGLGARGASVAASRLVVWRDIYYIADSSQNARPANSPVSDFDLSGLTLRLDGQNVRITDVAADSDRWSAYQQRRAEDFSTAEGQFFVMGDNSAASLDCRLWKGGSKSGDPGGPYLERSLLIGKAVCVYWPHSWGRVPGTPIPFPLFPNFSDMRLVR